jgi:hypothetical protein
MDTIRALNYLRAKVKEAAEHVTRAMLQCLWQEVKYSMGVCRVMKGSMHT